MRRLASLSLLLVTTAAFAQATYQESEPNDTKAGANVFRLGNNDQILGVSGAGDVDRYHLTFASTPRGFYRHELNVADFQGSNGVSFVGGLYGRSVDANGVIDPNSDVLVQSIRQPDFKGRTTFYTFGGEATLDYSVAITGASKTYRVSHNVARADVDTVKQVASFFRPGEIEITAGNQTLDTSLVLYDADFNVITTNDNAPGGGLGSRIGMTLAKGTYTVALSSSRLITNVGLGAGEATNPGSGLATRVFENPGILATTVLDDFRPLPLTIRDAQGTQYTATFFRDPVWDTGFYQFTVDPVPEPATMAALGLGTLALLRRRRKSA